MLAIGRLPVLVVATMVSGGLKAAHADEPNPTSSVYVGVEPRLMRESWYADDEFNVSVVPLVANLAVAKQVGLRIRPTVFGHFGGDSSQPFLALVGGSIAPYYYSSGARGVSPFGRFFIGPSVEVSRDRIESMWHVTLAADAGYAFALGGRWTFVLSGQVGYSWFSKDERDGDSHVGIYPSVGRWL